MRKITTIFVHCAATQPHWMEGKTAQEKVAEIDRWHRDRGFKKFGYHYFVDRDGTVVAGRPLDEVGAHVQGHNQDSVGICLAGGHGSSENDAFLDNFTFAQEQALRVLISELKIRVPSITKVRGHNEVAAKACPGFRVSRWLANKPAQRPMMASTTLQASATQIGSGAAGVWAALTQLEGTNQTIALVILGVVIAGGLWVMRERLKKWAEGIQ